jgi:carbamoyl-phosphate synthase large subunit
MLITSAGRRVGLLEAFRRGAGELGIDLEILACDMTPEWSAACRMADASFAVPPANDPDYADAVLEICREHAVTLLVPTIDTELLPLSRARPRFLEIGTDVATSAPELIEIARDKQSTADFLAANGIPTPKTASLSAVRDHAGEWRWPAILKPRHGSAGRSISVVRDAIDLPTVEQEPMIVQEQLFGDEWTVNLYFDHDSNLCATVPHLRVQVRAGEVEKGTTRRLPQLVAIAERMAQCLPEPRGVLCYQAIVAPDGIASVFEINARFGGGYPIADHAGAPFARWLLEQAAGLPTSAGDDWREGVTMLRYDAAVFVS